MLILFDWFFTVNKESVNGFHTKNVQVGILKGMILFILSEVMFFFSIFWSFFNYKINPSLYIECIFPPIGINIIKMNCFPLLNTVFLVYSGLFLMNSIFYLKKGRFFWSYINLVITIILGIFFVLVQFKEYSDSIFSFNDSCYGSVFFLLTGFHGFHVIIGLIFLLICCYRLYLTYKFNFYKINKDLYLKKLYRVFFFWKIFIFKILTKNRYVFLVTTTSEKNYIFEDFLEDLIKQDFDDIMYMILFFGIQDSIYHNKSKLKKKQFWCFKDISFKQVTKHNIKLTINDTYVFDNLINYCNIQKKEILFFFIYTNLIKKIFLLEFIYFFELEKDNNFLYFYKSYNFFLKSLKLSYDFNDITSRSKKFYSWKRILLWINYNNLNIKGKNLINIFRRRMDFKFILPFIGFKRDSNIGYICASWYWHFVDAIWIFVISVIYSDFLIIFFPTFDFFIFLN